MKQQINYLKRIDPDLKIFFPNSSYTNESLSRTDFLRTVRDPERCPSMQWSLLLLFLVEKVRKQIYQSKSIPDVHKFVLRPKIFSAGSLTKSYVKKRSILASKDFSQVLYSGLEMADTVKNIYQLLKYISAAQLATKFNIPILIKTPRRWLPPPLS